MKSTDIQSRILDMDTLKWPFESSVPYYRPGRYPDVEKRYLLKLNPRPCYPHSRELVMEQLALAESAFFVYRKPTVYLTHFDSEAGSNQAVTYEEECINEPGDEHRRPARDPFIILFGKPTPIHPAVTRYLVAHEYGHVVAEVLAREYSALEDPRPSFMRHYAELRGLTDVPDYYGPTTWHLHPEEIFANDFRLLVLGVEEEFWPHPKAPNPRSLPNLMKWWDHRASDAFSMGERVKANEAEWQSQKSARATSRCEVHSSNE